MYVRAVQADNITQADASADFDILTGNSGAEVPREDH